MTNKKEHTINVFSEYKFYKNENIDRYEKYRINNVNLSDEDIIKNVNLNLDYDFYELIIESINKHTPLVLVNKYYNLGSDYVPKNLINFEYPYAINNTIKGEKEAYEHFKDMASDARAINLTIKIVSAYRDYEYQKNLYENYLKNDPVNIVDSYSARAGHSEHQTGYAFDVYNVEKPYTSFGETDEFIWLKNNAHLYGFIIRYKEDNTYITGYKSEPWHIRYVGIENATYIYENNITLEEYLLNN